MTSVGPPLRERVASRILRIRDLGREELARWHELTSERAAPNAFYEPGFARAVARAGMDVRVCVLTVDGADVAFFPFQFPSRFSALLASAERVGGEMADYCSIVLHSSFRTSTTDLLRHARLATFSFTHLDENLLACGLEGEHPERGLRIELSNGGHDYWASVSVTNRKFVADTERRERKLASECGPLRFRAVVNDPGLLEQLIDQKRRQYRATKVRDVLGPEWRRRLLFELLAGDDPLCRPVLSVLHAGDRWVASHFGLQSGGTLHYWFPVYNPDFHEYAPGRLLLKALIAHSGEIGIASIDRGAGESRAKLEFANAEHYYYRGVWFRPGVRALSSRCLTSLGWRLESLRAPARGLGPSATRRVQ